MTDDNDARLSGLYRKSSREEPPAHLDRAVVELARRSLRRRSLVTSGNHWVAAGALAGICLVSVLLVVLLSRQGDISGLPQTLQDANAPQPGSLEKRPSREPGRDETASGTIHGKDGDAGAPQRFDFYSVMPEATPGPPAGEGGAPAVTAPMSPQATTPQPAGGTAVFVLQLGGFSSLAQARAMQDKLAFMRLDAGIEPVAGTQGGYRIRIGPYSNIDELDRVQALLDRRGIRSTRERLR